MSQCGSDFRERTLCRKECLSERIAECMASGTSHWETATTDGFCCNSMESFSSQRWIWAKDAQENLSVLSLGPHAQIGDKRLGDLSGQWKIHRIAALAVADGKFADGPVTIFQTQPGDFVSAKTIYSQQQQDSVVTLALIGALVYGVQNMAHLPVLKIPRFSLAVEYVRSAYRLREILRHKPIECGISQKPSKKAGNSSDRLSLIVASLLHDEQLDIRSGHLLKTTLARLQESKETRCYPDVWFRTRYSSRLNQVGTVRVEQFSVGRVFPWWTGVAGVTQ